MCDILKTMRGHMSILLADPQLIIALVYIGIVVSTVSWFACMQFRISRVFIVRRKWIEDLYSHNLLVAYNKIPGPRISYDEITDADTMINKFWVWPVSRMLDWSKLKFTPEQQAMAAAIKAELSAKQRITKKSLEKAANEVV